MTVAMADGERLMAHADQGRSHVGIEPLVPTSSAQLAGADFEPQIVSFLCRWCSYPGADLAGTSRLAYSPSVRVIRVPCSGRVDPLFVLKAFQEGADGVMVLGCHPGDCHYLEGNYYARRRYALMHRLLEYVGIEKERLLVDWVSAAEGGRFARLATDFAAQVGELGRWTQVGWGGHK
jgi:coenzyme F420-reducing hydrogenase delta subunit